MSTIQALADHIRHLAASANQVAGHLGSFNQQISSLQSQVSGLGRTGVDTRGVMSSLSQSAHAVRTGTDAANRAAQLAKGFADSLAGGGGSASGLGGGGSASGLGGGGGYPSRDTSSIAAWKQASREQFLSQSDGTQAAIVSYSGIGHKSINGLLRGDSTRDSPDVRSKIAHLDSAMRPLGSDTTLYRGVSSKYAPNVGVGGTTTFDSYLSTSVERKTPKGFGDVLLVLKTPSSAPSFPINGSGGHPEENEILLGRGSSWVCQDISVVNGTTVYTLEMIGA